MKKYFSSPTTYVAMALGVITMDLLTSLQSSLFGVTKPLAGYILPTFIGALTGFLLSAIRLRSLEQNQNQKNFFFGIVQSLSMALDVRDAYTYGHSSRVTILSVALGRRIGLNKAQLEALELGGILHDIGKIGISDTILNKPETLTAEEFKIVQTHPVKGEQILNASNSPKSKMISECIRSHHERYDGTGYPDGLKGDAIPALARIITISDAFDAMISSRPYRGCKMTIRQAMEELGRCSGSQFDPMLVAEFEKMLASEEGLLGKSVDGIFNPGGVYTQAV
ncbi:MAG: HD-GYP domain-containing protein [Desulfuromonadales bacterium]|nr:HD-GYP domain-containing protein [Desulfuromonadales bacterium]